MKRFIAIVLTLVTLLVSIPLCVTAAGGIQEKIDTIRSVYPTGSYFTVASSSSGCTSYNHDTVDGSWCYGCYLPNIPSRGGLPAGSAVGWGADTCCGFANYVFYCIYGHNKEANTTTKYSNPVFGDLVYTGSHWFIYLSEDSNYYYVYDANGYNGGNKNKVIYNNSYPKSIVSSLTVYHSNSYDSVNATAPHTCNKGEYLFREEVHPHCSCYRCSVCGKIWRDETSSNVLETCVICNKPGKPQLLNIQRFYTENDSIKFEWNATENTTHYNLFIEKLNADGEWKFYESAENGYYVNSGITKSFEQGEYRALLESYNSNLWESDNSDWLHTLGDYVYFIVTHEHSYGEWVVVTPPSITTDGLEKQICSICGDEQTRIIPKESTSHNFRIEVFEPTCNEGGRVVYTCTDCGYIYEIKAGDGVSEWQENKPEGVSENLIETKTQYRYSEKDTTQSESSSLNGWTRYDAKITDWTAWSSWQNEAVSASSDREVTTRYIEPTYKTVWHYDRSVSSDGKYSSYGTSYYPNYQSITLDYQLSAKGTVDGQTRYGAYDGGYGTYLQNYWWNERSEAVINTYGYTQYSYRNAVYTYYFFKWSDMSAWNDEFIEENDNTKVETRTLYRYKLPDALGHDLIHHDGKNPTCTESGWMPYDSCSRCEYTTYQAVSTQGHSYTVIVIAPTPTSQGYTLHTCSKCGDSYKDNYTSYIEPDPTAAKAVIEKKTAAPGDTVTVSITLENAPALKTLAVRDIAYDTSKLELVGGKWNIEGAMIADWNQADKNAVLAFGSNTDVNGNVFTLTFKVIEETEDAEVSVSCKLVAKEKPDGGEETEVDVSVISGAVIISNAIRGDVNGDGYVDSDDAIHLLRHVLMSDSYEINQNGDFNGDGKIDSDDAIYLLYHVLIPDRYPLK